MKGRGIFVAAAVAFLFLVAAIWGTIWILQQPIPQAGDEERDPFEGEVAQELDSSMGEEGVAEGRIQVKLYVLASSGRELATETREIPFAPSLQQQAKEVVRLLLRRSAAIPSGVELRELFITSQGVAYVDLSQELVANHPGGSSAEELTVFSLTETLIANFPAIKTAKILVEGKEIQTLAGHLDLTVPYGRAPAYLQPPSERPESRNEAG